MDGTGELLTALVDQLSPYRPVQSIAYPPALLGYDELADFVAKHAPEERFVIVGESFSGPIAIEIAATEPRVAGMVLVSSFCKHPMPSLFAPVANLLDLKWVPNAIVEWALLGTTGDTELKAHLRKVLATLPREIVRFRAAEALRVDKRDRLRTIACPILCLQGRFDRLVRKKCLDEITSIQPRSQVRWFAASHMLMETHPREAAQSINEFCDRLR